MKRPIIDQHVHTNYSPDANKEASFEAYIKTAKMMQLPGITFTDHIDLQTPVELFEDYPDYETYLKEIQALNRDDFFVRMGVEVGYQPKIKDALNDLINKHPFDFVIASIHAGDGLDFYNQDFFKGKSQKEAYKRYFEILLDMVENYDNYDVVGHLDYIIRYGDFNDKSLQMADYQPLIDKILKTLIKKQKGIEINTSGLRYDLGVTHPKYEIIKRYKDLGGEIITLGSDAHQTKDLYADFDKALALLLKAGFKYVTEFKKRKPIKIEL